MTRGHNGTNDEVLELELARRIRVARCYSGLSRDELAERLGVSFQTVERSETGRRRITLDELVRVGHACDVPEAFMRYGWAACAPKEELERLYRRLDELSRDLRHGLVHRPAAA